MYLNWKWTLPRVYFRLYILFCSAVIRLIWFTFDDSCYLTAFWTFPMHLSASHTTTPIIPKYLIGINVVVDCASNLFFPNFCFVQLYISHVCRSRDVFCIWFPEREIKLRVYLRQANKRSTPFHHADDPLFSFKMWNSDLVFWWIFFSTFISTSAAVIPFSLYLRETLSSCLVLYTCSFPLFS
jgi:hypothetical protein